MIPLKYTNRKYVYRDEVFYRSVESESVLVRLKKQCCLSLLSWTQTLQWQAAAQGYGCLPAKWHTGCTTTSSNNARERKRKPLGKSVTDHCHALCTLLSSIQFYFLVQFPSLCILMCTLGILLQQINGSW